MRIDTYITYIKAYPLASPSVLYKGIVFPPSFGANHLII